jgi:UDP-glucose 4-epimerase
MTTESVLITGGYGCIGSEVAKWLIRNTDSRVIIASRQVSDQRSRIVFSDVELPRLAFVPADVCDQRVVEAILADYQITHVAHMAGLQTPDCNAHRDLGLQVNLAGTQNLIEAMKRSKLAIQRFIFASSIAVYGPRAAYPPGPVPMLAQPQPVNVYGTWKLAGEQISQFFAIETGVPTISIRPGVLFGPGRDAGLTSTPTTAMKHIALKQAYKIPYANKQDYLYAPDVGAAVGSALMEPFAGYATFTLPSHTVDTNEMVRAMHAAAAELQLAQPIRISVGDSQVPFICDLEFQPFLDAFPSVPHTPLKQAVQQSIETFVEQVERGILHV